MKPPVANVIVWPKVFERLRPDRSWAHAMWRSSARVQEESRASSTLSPNNWRISLICLRSSPNMAPRSMACALRRGAPANRGATRGSRSTGNRRNRLSASMREMPELAGDLGVSAARLGACTHAKGYCGTRHLAAPPTLTRWSQASHPALIARTIAHGPGFSRSCHLPDKQTITGRPGRHDQIFFSRPCI